MRYFVITDMEGVAGISDTAQWVYPGAPYYERGKKLLTGETNAVIEGIFTADPQAEVHVLDGHGCGGLNPLELDPRAFYITPQGMGYPFVTTKYDAMLWVGQHARAGSTQAHLAHTGSFELIDQSINGLSIGEFGAIALCGWELGVPSIFGGGDQAFCKEARALVSEMITISGKEGLQTDPGDALSAKEYELHNRAARHRHFSVVREDLYRGATSAVRRFLSGGASAFRITGLPRTPYTARKLVRDTAPRELITEPLGSIADALNQLLRLH